MLGTHSSLRVRAVANLRMKCEENEHSRLSGTCSVLIQSPPQPTVAAINDLIMIPCQHFVPKTSFSLRFHFLSAKVATK